jgi:hypothetical protein
MSVSNPTLAAGSSHNSLIRLLGFLALAMTGSSMEPVIASSPSVTLAWDANPEPNIAHYKLSYGMSSGVYGTDLNAGPNTQVLVPNLVTGTTYYFVVSAIDTNGAQSPYSNEVSYFVPSVTANRAPVALAMSVSTPEDTAAGIALQGTDADNDPLSYSIVTGPTKGSLSGAAPNLTYKPSANYHGTDSFTFIVSDGKVSSAPARVSISVTPVNDAPVAMGKSVTTPQGTALPITLDATDVDGDTLTFAVVSGPANGTLSGTAPNLTYTPAASFSGTDQFSFRANDGIVNSATATISITVTPTDSLPLPWTAQQIGSGNLPGSVSFSGGVYTLSGSGALGGTQDALNFTWMTLSGNGEISAQVSKLSDTGTGTRVGVMIRESLAANSRHAFIGINHAGAFQWLVRSATGTAAVATTSAPVPTPAPWVRLVRQGNTFTSFKSTNGINWIKVGSSKLQLPSNCYIGLAVSSGSNTVLNTSQFSKVSIK